MFFFNALHGPFGEDGKIQKILRNKKFLFTHSDQFSSANCFDKLKSKKIDNKYQITTPSFEIIKSKNINSIFLKSIKKKFHKFVIKPVSSGSSYGLKIIKSYKDLQLGLIKTSLGSFLFKKIFVSKPFVSSEGKSFKA